MKLKVNTGAGFTQKMLEEVNGRKEMIILYQNLKN